MNNNKVVNRILKRTEVMMLLNRSSSSIETLCNDGILHKIVLAGRIRACGFNSAEVYALINGKTIYQNM